MAHLEVEIDMPVDPEMQKRHDQLVAGGASSRDAWRRTVQEQLGYLIGDVQSATLVE